MRFHGTGKDGHTFKILGETESVSALSYRNGDGTGFTECFGVGEGYLRLKNTATASLPSSPDEGAFVYDSTDKTPKFHDASSWKALPTNSTVRTYDFIPVADMFNWPGKSNPAAIASHTGGFGYQYRAFDDSTDEFLSVMAHPPPGWAGSSMSLYIYWAAAGAGTCSWSIYPSTVTGDGDDLTGEGAIAQGASINAGSLNDADLLDASGPATISVNVGTYADRDILQFGLYRAASIGADSLTGDARLIGIRIEW